MDIRVAREEDKPLVYALRMEVFVKEQGVPPELEMDGDDRIALHMIAEEQGEAIGCARILLHGASAHMGRIAVKRVRRGEGIGSRVVRFAIEQCRERGCTHIDLGAQLHAVSFYESLGFQTHGEPFMEAGIVHIAMTMELKQVRSES